MNATGRLTTRRHILLMAKKNPMGERSAFALTIPPHDLPFLCSTLTMTRDGIADELARFGDQLREPARLRREEAAYGRLLTALEGDSIVPDHDIERALASLAEVIDTANEYSRVVAEHDALHGLLAQIDGSREKRS
jgi:hypothetical protein